MNMTNSVDFDKLTPVDDISGVLEDVFGLKLDVYGGWGYDNNSVLKVRNINIPKKQFFHTFASMRANIEMNLILDEDQRYGGINVSEIQNSELKVDNKTYEVVTFKITAMKEKKYNDFIQEYKDNYGKDDFDIAKHFKDREENTIEINQDFWFVFE